MITCSSILNFGCIDFKDVDFKKKKLPEKWVYLPFLRRTFPRFSLHFKRKFIDEKNVL